MRSDAPHEPSTSSVKKHSVSASVSVSSKRFPSLSIKGDLKGTTGSSSSSTSSIRSRLGTHIEHSDVDHKHATTQEFYLKKFTHTSEISRVRNRNVHQFSEWGWSDKELVLKILFAKIHESKQRVGDTMKMKDSRDISISMDMSDFGMDEVTVKGDCREDDNGNGNGRQSYELPFFVSEGAVDCMPYQLSSHQAAVNRRGFNATC